MLMEGSTGVGMSLTYRFVIATRRRTFVSRGPVDACSPGRPAEPQKNCPSCRYRRIRAFRHSWRAEADTRRSGYRLVKEDRPGLYAAFDQ
jgi:hypothetical protein